MPDEQHPIIQMLKEHCKSGDSFVEADELYSLCAAGEPNMSRSEFREELTALSDAAQLLLDGDLVYLREVWEDEEYLAVRLAGLLRTEPQRTVILPEVITSGKLTLSVEQREAVSVACSSPVSVIIGGAGSGKSASACAVIDTLGIPPVELVLCAPTGKAARNLCDAAGYPAATLHHALHISFDGSVHTGGALDGKKLVIVDEAGMVPLHLYAALFKAAPPDCRILLLGDENQLLGVGPGNVLPGMLELGLPYYRLTELHRQKDVSSALYHNVSHFSQIRRAEDLMLDDSFQVKRGTDAELRSTLIADAVSSYRSGRAARVITPRRRDVSLSMQELNACIQNEVNPDREGLRSFQLGSTVFRDGAPVMITMNSTSRFCFNGDTGTLAIREVNGKERYYAVLPDGRKPFWSKNDSFIPLELAYAMTVHKAQGSGYDTVFLPLSMNQMSNMLTRNLLYTAISRAREHLIIFSADGALEKALQTDPPPRRSRLVEKTRQNIQRIKGGNDNV